MRVRFAHLELDDSVYDWHGAQIALLGFDELTSFSEHQFSYMLSRNRSDSGVPGYVRATCNPDADSWVRTLIDWWIGEDGYPIPERSGVVRWFVRRDDEIVWGASKAELERLYGADCMPKSLTFIASTVYDNKILLAKDPGYLANLKSLPKVERLRLLGEGNRGGNWNVRATAGMFFNRSWFTVLDAIPAAFNRQIRFWDRAATRPTPEKPEPDWTRGLKLLRYPNNTFLVADLRSLRDSPGQVEKLVRATASHDGYDCQVMSQQDPGSAGVAESDYFIRLLAGFDVSTETLTQNKTTRAKPVSAQAEAGNIFVLRAPWNEEFFRELEGFPDGKHDDIVDVLSGAFNALAVGHSMFDAT